MPPVLSTSPNASVPAYRRKLDDIAADGEAPKQAAGVLFVAPDGDILLLHRSGQEANYAGHWALPGGGVEDGESALDGALRECREEMAHDAEPNGAKLLDRVKTPNGLAFSTFAVPAKEKFVPKLNEEHSGFTWAPLSALPGPLHPSVAATLKNRIGGAEDMAPEDWSGLRDGFVKWTREEEAEPEHANDSALLAFDKDSVRTVDKVGRLHIARTHITKATVNPYRGDEIPFAEKLGLDADKIYHLLRDPQELEKAAATSNGIQVLQKHVGVHADDHKPDEVVGSTGNDCVFEYPYLDNSMTIWARNAIDGIEKEIKRELSSSYSYRAEMTPGYFDGMRYDGVMRDIVFNHVALVENGRAGPDVLVGDSMENLMATKSTILALNSMRLTARALVPLLAMDAKLPNLMPAFKELTPKNFAAKKPSVIEYITKHGKLAKDASLEGVVELLDMLEAGAGKPGLDAMVSPEQEGEMESIGKGEAKLGMPEAVKPAAKDDEPLRNFLTEKGMAAEDIESACGMMPRGAATDSEMDDDAEDEDVTETEEEKAERMKKEAKDKKAADKRAADKAAKDKEMSGMIDKKAMDQAITSAVSTARKQEQGIRTAIAEVTPIFGELSPTLAFDSADDVYRHVAVAMGIEDADIIHASALPTLIKLQRKPGAHPTERLELAMDSAQSDGIASRFPDLARIQHA